MHELTQEIVRELLHYDPETGLLYWKERDVKWFRKGPRTAQGQCNLWNGRNSDKVASNENKITGYCQVRIFNRRYQAHRIIWFWYYGSWPKNQIDHLDGNRANNRIDNLADKTNAENRKNRGIDSRNKSGFPGVSWNTEKQKWKAQISVNGKNTHLCYANTPEEAHAIYAAKARELGYTERHINAREENE